MNGVDYSKSLARERDNYQNTIQQDRAQSAKRLAAEQERHKAIQTKQLETFDKDRTELAGAYKQNIEGIQERTKESIDQMKDRFHKQNREEEHRFHEERETTRKDFDGRMREIKNSYTRANKNEKLNNEAIQENQKRRYDSNVQQLVVDKDKKLAEFQEGMYRTGGNIKDQYQREKEQIVRAHEDQLQSIYKDEGQKRFTLKEGLHRDLQKTKETHRASAEQSQQYSREKVKNLAENFNSRVNQMADEYSTRNKKFVEALAAENFQKNKQHQAELSDVHSNAERQIRNIEIESRRRDNGNGEFAEIVQRQQGNKSEQMFEDRLERMKGQNAEAQRRFNNHVDDLTEGHGDTLRTQSVESAARLERAQREMTADKIVNVSNEREKAQKHQSLQQISQLTERQRYENQISTERNQADKQLKKLKEDFHRSLLDLEQKNEKFAKELKEQTNDDKVKFIANTNLQRNDEIMTLRRNFNKLMDTTVGEYESRLATTSRENVQLREELNQKVGFLIADADRRVEQQTKIYEDKRGADLKSNQALMDLRESNFRTKIRDVTNSYQSKMDRQSYDAEMKMKHIVNEYEAKIKQQDAAFAKTISEKNNLHSAELKRLKSALEAEKAQIITQYENQMSQIKLSHKEEQERLNDYKKMG